MTRLGLIVNPTSGRNSGARIGLEALTLLRAAGTEVLDLSAADARGALEHGRAAIADRSVDAVVVAGGDGMVHLGANLCAGTDVPLGVVAAGTGNDIARELGLPVRDAAKAVERILHGRTRPVDAGRLVTAAGEERWFAGGAGCRVRRHRQRAGQPVAVAEGARCATTSRSCAELPVFRPIPYVLDPRRAADRTPTRCSSRSATAPPTAAACG